MGHLKFWAVSPIGGRTVGPSRIFFFIFTICWQGIEINNMVFNFLHAHMENHQLFVEIGSKSEQKFFDRNFR